jgi:hypothetical protein
MTADPLIVHACHCLNCQNQTGSAFVINILIETDRLEILSGEPAQVDVPRGEGVQPIWRCPTCQVALFSEYGFPFLRFVRAGTLDDPGSVTPDVHIYTRSKREWVVLPDSTPAFEEFYDPAAVWSPEMRQRFAAAQA